MPLNSKYHRNTMMIAITHAKKQKMIQKKFALNGNIMVVKTMQITTTITMKMIMMVILPLILTMFLMNIIIHTMNIMKLLISTMRKMNVMKMTLLMRYSILRTIKMIQTLKNKTK